MKSKGKKTAIIAILIILTLAFVILPLCSYQVRESEIAIISTFGKYDDSENAIKKSGLHFKLPWPVQKVHRLPKTQQVYQGRFTEKRTADKGNYNLILRVYAVWKINKPRVFLSNVGQKNLMNGKLDSIISAANSSIIKDTKLTDLLSADAPASKSNQKLIELENKLKTNVSNQIAEKFGIELIDLGIEQIALPNSKDIIASMKSILKNKADVLISEANTDSKKIILEAETESSKNIAEAKNKAEQIRSELTERMADIYKKYDDIELAIFLKELESLETMLAEKTYMIADKELLPIQILKGEYRIDKKKE